MTSYGSERDFLLDQIKSNKEAIEFIEQELEKVSAKLLEDHAGTAEKIIGVYTKGINSLKRDNLQKEDKVKALTCDEPDDLYRYEMSEIPPEIEKDEEKK